MTGGASVVVALAWLLIWELVFKMQIVVLPDAPSPAIPVVAPLLPADTLVRALRQPRSLLTEAPEGTTVLIAEAVPAPGQGEPDPMAAVISALAPYSARGTSGRGAVAAAFDDPLTALAAGIDALRAAAIMSRTESPPSAPVRVGVAGPAAGGSLRPARRRPRSDGGGLRTSARGSLAAPRPRAYRRCGARRAALAARDIVAVLGRDVFGRCESAGRTSRGRPRTSIPAPSRCRRPRLPTPRAKARHETRTGPGSGRDPCSFHGADAGTRTPNLWFTKPLLCRLSYAGTRAGRLYVRRMHPSSQRPAERCLDWPRCEALSGDADQHMFWRLICVSILRFTRCRALSTDFTCLCSPSAISW